MKNCLRVVAAAAALVPVLASAQASSPLTGNLTVTSDYRFRGLSQSYRQPAVQGGIDYAHSSGLYAGNWNSSISGNQYPNGASLEMDFYGGYKAALGNGVSIDVGGLYYFYPGAYYNDFSSKPDYDNFELYAGSAFGPFSAKISIAVTDFFGLDETTGGNGSSKGSYYLEANYATEIMPKLTLGAHIGYQDVRNYSDLSYIDYKVGVTYDWTGWMLGAAIVGTDADKDFYPAANSTGTRDIVKPGLVVSISKAF